MGSKVLEPLHTPSEWSSCNSWIVLGGIVHLSKVECVKINKGTVVLPENKLGEDDNWE